MIVEANDSYGGQPKYLFGDKYVYDFPGFVKITGLEIAENLYQQYLYNAPDFKLILNQDIANIERDKITNHFIVSFTNQETHIFKKILVTSGNGKFSPRKMPKLAKQTFDNLHYKISDKIDCKNNLIIFGGGDSAIDWANHFQEKHPNINIYVIHRRVEFRAKTANINKAKKNNIKFYNGYQVVDFVTDKKSVKSVTIKNEDQTLTLTADHFIVQYGQICNPLKNPIFDNIIKGHLNKFKVDSRQATNIADIYAAGSCSTFVGKTHVISSDLGDAVNAITSIAKDLNPKLSPIFYTSVLKNKK